MLYGKDPEQHTYRRRAHLAEIIALLGPPPKNLLARGNLTPKFFTEEGKQFENFTPTLQPLAIDILMPGTSSGCFNAGINVPTSTSLEEIETDLAGEDKVQFLRFMRKMLQWAPEQRSPAEDLYQDP